MSAAKEFSFRQDTTRKLVNTSHGGAEQVRRDREGLFLSIGKFGDLSAPIHIRLPSEEGEIKFFSGERENEK